MHKYQIAIWWSEDDNAFLAMAPQLPRCIADGPTPEAALHELNIVIEMWMESAHEDGWPIPQPPGRMVPVRNEFDWKPLPAPDQKRAVKNVSAKNAAKKNGALQPTKSKTKQAQPA